MWPSLTVRSLGLLFIVTVLFKFALSGWTPLQHHDWQVTTVPKVPGMVYTCVTSCKTNFSTAGGLNRHQNSCAVYKTAQALKIEQRRAGKQKVQPKDKLDVRKARIQDAQAHQHVVVSPNISTLECRVSFQWMLESRSMGVAAQGSFQHRS
jgi:hypothetical protein